MPPNFPVAILAGGLATRLRPITEKIPKGLAEVAGKPFLTHQLGLLKQRGLKRVVLCVGYLGEMIRREYADGSALGLRIDYSFDGDKLLGTGGALIRALPLLGEAFYVLYGDSYLPIDYQAVGRHFLENGKLGLMTVYENRERYDASNVWFAGGEIKVYDKKNKLPAMRHIDYGLGLFHAEAFSAYPRGTPLDLSTVQTDLCRQGQLAGYEVKERFYEIGSPGGLNELDAKLRAQSHQ